MAASSVFGLLYSILLVVLTSHGSEAIPIDNGVVGVNVECTAEAISVSFETENPFGGRIYVKGMSTNDQCLRSYSDGSQPASNRPDVKFPFGACNMLRSRTLSPQKGMMQSLVVIISFHRIFLTKVDRAYRVQCFYMEADKTVSAEFSVSMLTTDDIRDTAAMPTCSYTVRSGSQDGPPVRFARIGDKVFHEWECDSASHNILIKNCFVHDGQGNQQEVLDNRGCAIDPVIMPDLTYESDGRAKAWVESHVFKYADKPTVLFQCVVQICNRGEASCTSITPPTCASSSLLLLRSRRDALPSPLLLSMYGRQHRRENNATQRRLHRISTTLPDDHAVVPNGDPEMDLQSNSFVVLDLEEASQGREVEQARRQDAGQTQDQWSGVLPKSNRDSSGSEPQASSICMSPLSFSVLLGIIGVLTCLSIAVAAVLCCYRSALLDRRLLEGTFR